MKLKDLQEANEILTFTDKKKWKEAARKRGDVKLYAIEDEILAIVKLNRPTTVGIWNVVNKTGKVYKKSGLRPLDSTLKKLKLIEAEDMSELQPAAISELEKKIREGAKDLEQKWANALELVHKAYQVLGIERPSPSMKGGWKQYEDLITFAVKELSKTRGLSDEQWRMSAPSTKS